MIYINVYIYIYMLNSFNHSFCGEPVFQDLASGRNKMRCFKEARPRARGRVILTPVVSSTIKCLSERAVVLVPY